MRKGPAFIGIGASFAGLTQVTTWLAEHDEIVDVLDQTYIDKRRDAMREELKG